MKTDKALVKISKFLSLVLRHKPEEIGIILDRDGWTRIDVLLTKMRTAKWEIDRDLFDIVVRDNDKKRFTVSEDGKLVRAAQGHSVDVKIDSEPVSPPESLYHGTATRFLDSIFAEGLKPGSRTKVHLSTDYDTAVKVGERHGKPIVLALDVPGLVKAGQMFWCADNGVYLSDPIAPEYLSVSPAADLIPGRQAIEAKDNV